MTTDQVALWQQAFGDSPEFIAGFFRTGYHPDRCRCLSVDGKLAAVLYWFDCRWQDRKVAYIYAVATDRDFRGQGLCRRLMTETHQHLRQLGYDGAALVPGEPGLFAMYEKLGYRGFCPMEKQTVLPGGQPVIVTQIRPERYALCKLPAGAVEQGSEALSFFETYGQFYAFDGGCFCAAREGDTLYVQEFLGDPAALPGIVAALGVRQAHVRLPGGDMPFAMYHSFTDGALPSYLAIALD